MTKETTVHSWHKVKLVEVTVGVHFSICQLKLIEYGRIVICSGFYSGVLGRERGCTAYGVYSLF